MEERSLFDELIDDLEPEPEVALVPRGPERVTEVMPRDFKLPVPIKFVPDEQIRTAVDAATTTCLALVIVGQGATALQQADTHIGALRAAIKAVEQEFEDPTREADQEHKRLTGLRATWIKRPAEVLKIKEGEVYREQTRLKDEAAEAQRRAQAEADRLVREAAQAAAKEAEGKAPKAVVKELKKAAKTAVAPPVASPTPAPVLAHTTTTERYRTRFIDTDPAADPHPAVKDLTNPQRLQLIQTLKAIVDGKAPIAIIKELDWGYLDERARKEETALAIPGIEVWKEGGTRAKPGRKL